jgi:transposase
MFRIETVEAVIVREHRTNPVSRRLASIPGIGPITASAIAATIGDPLGVPVRPRTGGMDRLGSTPALKRGQTEAGRVSKQGDRYLRRLLTIGATSVMRRLAGKTDGHSAWVRTLLDRRPFRLVSLALANKMARIAWAVMVRQEDYRRPLAAAV